MATIDFFFDPICPWAYLTSRFVAEVQANDDLTVNWRFISLQIVNEARDYEAEFPAGYTKVHGLGHRLLRVAAATRDRSGNDAVGRLYAALGEVIHHQKARDRIDGIDGLQGLLGSIGLDETLASAMQDEAHDAVLRDETAIALDRAGKDVGTPILTFGPPDGPSFFGPVLSRVPTGKAAVTLFHDLERLAQTPGFFELKRSIREAPQVA
jgi:2-hydroxychromene-2-carboxylate isomerase